MKYKSLVIEKIHEVKKDIEKIKISAQPVSPDPSLGRITRMDAIGAQNMAKANLRDAEIRLKKLEMALKRIDDGNYGECLACGEEIKKSRLKRIPETTLCIECAKAREK